MSSVSVSHSAPEAMKQALQAAGFPQLHLQVGVAAAYLRSPMGAEEIVSRVLALQLEGPSLTKATGKGQVWWYTLATPELGKQRLADPGAH